MAELNLLEMLSVDYNDPALDPYSQAVEYLPTKLNVNQTGQASAVVISLDPDVQVNRPRVNQSLISTSQSAPLEEYSNSYQTPQQTPNFSNVKHNFSDVVNLAAGDTIPNYRLSDCCSTCVFVVYDSVDKSFCCRAYSNSLVKENFVCDSFLNPLSLFSLKEEKEEKEEEEKGKQEQSIEKEEDESVEGDIEIADKEVYAAALDLHSVSKLTGVELELSILNTYRALYMAKYGNLTDAFTLST